MEYGASSVLSWHYCQGNSQAKAEPMSHFSRGRLRGRSPSCKGAKRAWLKKMATSQVAWPQGQRSCSASPQRQEGCKCMIPLGHSSSLAGPGAWVKPEAFPPGEAACPYMLLWQPPAKGRKPLARAWASSLSPRILLLAA